MRVKSDQGKSGRTLSAAEMMKTRDSITIALCASLVVHTLLLGALCEHYALTRGFKIWLPPFERNEAESTIFLADVDDRGSDFGQNTGGGEAVNSSEGDEPMKAHLARSDQAFLSLDPEGVGDLRAAPSPSPLPPGPTLASAEIAQPFGVAQPPPPPPVTKRALPQSVVDRGELTEVSPEPRDTPVDEPKPVAEVSTPVAAAAPTVIAAAAAAPGGSAAPANPAPQADSESDPFSTDGGFEFRRGRVVSRYGRKVKTIAPRLSLAGKWDLVSGALPRVLLKVSIDENGKVTLVDVLKSSGSNEVDQPCKVAVYQWQFEPSRDSSGKAIPDVLMIPITFH